MLIDIFHDPVCPWCRIGKKHLFDALAKWQEEEVDIRWHPFILDNTIPADGYEFRSFMQNRKGIKAQELQYLFDSTQYAGEMAGVKLNFDKIRLAVNTKLSHRLITLAPAKVKNDVVEAIYKAYFEAGLNIGDIEVLIAIGRAYQMDSRELRLQLSDDAAIKTFVAESIFARPNGINSVPFFIINNKVKINGSHSVDIFLQALNRATLVNI
ncbi:putative dithiol-disulfide isomerase, DsbA family [Nostoc flagelliforme CCNUN1]|uniref:Putative dithiol-disulfide isomerase, DsbA family n=1 Tax=Nostoc flagelliforme CCNUN1 TaxID=2038116 RepID=A0A2K8SHM5_9NOSO|nr:DsbA family oxidoreductase [Nostoc flagelliforme]AUB34939.1 putative dithiol-disulfide isomerase, DsbA family [Nostoc flagelliforme CCNUN1]